MAQFSRGDRVILHSMKTDKFNDALGVVVGERDADTGRYPVQFDNKELGSGKIKEENLKMKKKYRKKRPRNKVAKKAESGEKITVLLEDQQRINKFSQTNRQHDEVADLLKAKEKEIQTLKDALEEVEMCMEDDGIRLQIGECFVSAEEDSATDHVNDLLAKREKEKDELIAQRDDLAKTMDTLKVQLYAKFGKQINLETSERDE